ncbi:lytic polysaccharide monooxygenase [Saccharata proteae CBS 121410]|uniref:Lytic polysaccharide monooxygenase n=1 Tax=Saccharata proteae CBS 121410 TaxID=1314787 RepID=A0A9P4HVF7_9PEZI|nr:lytic polysaccharide monooxygenase [Saccharata proteae CBS 121410]
MHLTALTLLIGALATASAHMQLLYPPPFNASNNPHLNGGTPDSELVYPQGCCAKNNTAICRGYLSLLGTPAGAPVATWTAGQNIIWNITGDTSITGFEGGGTHYGGSCQVGFSVDKGESFQVAASYEGNCPHRNAPSDGSSGQNFEMQVPEELPEGEAVFAWSWINREQEFFMDCAAVTIVGKDGDAGSSSSSTVAAPSYTQAPTPSASEMPATSAASRPKMLIPDPIFHDPKLPKTTAEVKFPDPGPVVVEGDGAYPLELPST